MGEKAPDRIWVDVASIEADDQGFHVTGDPENIHSEYVSADIAGALADALNAIVTALEDGYSPNRHKLADARAALSRHGEGKP